MSWRVVIPSARADYLIPCVRAIRRCEPQIPPSAVIVVDDGAKAESSRLLLGVTWVRGVKPFVFARNVNRGIRAARGSDVIVLNDDARLVTPRGFTRLAAELRRHPDVGICSAGIQGAVCNPRQRAGHDPELRDEYRLAFMCVYLSRRAIRAVGLLDERFTGYGYDDFDYCRRVREAGFTLAVWDGCVVNHKGHGTYGTRREFGALLDQGRQLYREKWGSED